MFHPNSSWVGSWDQSCLALLKVKELDNFLATSAAAPWRLSALHQPPQPRPEGMGMSDWNQSYCVYIYI